MPPDAAPPGMSLRPPPTTSSLVMVVRVFFTEALSVSLQLVDSFQQEIFDIDILHAFIVSPW